MKTIFNTLAICTLGIVLAAPATSFAQNKNAKDSLEKVRVNAQKNAATQKKLQQRVTVNGKNYSRQITVGSQGSKSDTLKNSHALVITNNGKQIFINRNGMPQEIRIVINGDSVWVGGVSIYDSANPNFKIINDIKGRELVLSSLQGMNFNLDFPTVVNSFKGYSMLGVATEYDKNGIIVTGVTKGSAAEKAGLKVNDILLAVNSVKIATTEELQKEIRSYAPGTTINIDYIRDSKFSTAKATLTQNNADLGQIRYYNIAPPSDSLKELQRIQLRGLVNRMPNPFFLGDGKLNDVVIENYNNRNKAYQTPPPAIRALPYTQPQKWGITAQETKDRNGVIILDVEKNSIAENAGIRKNDVLLNFQEKGINDIGQLLNWMQMSRPGQTINLTISRKGKIIQTEVKIPESLKTIQM